MDINGSSEKEIEVSALTEGVIIGAAGGAIAGVMVYLVKYVHDKGAEKIESSRIERWLRSNTSDEQGKRYRSTRSIASWNNVTMDRARYLCSINKNIYLSTGEKEDMWSVYIRSSEERSDEGPGIHVL